MFVDADVVCYLRESAAERLLCLASRASHAPVSLPAHLLDCSELEPLTGAEAELVSASAVLPADGPSFHVWRMN